MRPRVSRGRRRATACGGRRWVWASSPPCARWRRPPLPPRWGRASARHVVTTPATIPLHTAILDSLFSSSSPDRQEGLDMARGAGATYVRLPATWNNIAPSSPSSSFVATDPTSPGYYWTQLDSMLDERRGGRADADPRHRRAAELGRHDPAERRQRGHARASPRSGEFATALATHYDGTPGRAGRARVPGLERAEPQPRPQSGRPGGRTGTWSTPSPTRCTRSIRRTSSSPAASTRSAIRRARSRSGTRRRRWPSCARCSASRRERIRTRPATRRSTSTSGRITRTRSAARSATRRIRTTSRSATSPNDARAAAGGRPAAPRRSRRTRSSSG